MNIRLQKYTANRLAGMNQYKAARAAGYAESTSRGKIAMIERSAKVGILDAFEEAGLTNEYLARIAVEGLECEGMLGFKFFHIICKLTGRL